MTDAALSIERETLAGSVECTRRSELKGWAALAIGALALAGSMAFLLALSRVPGIERWLPWPAGFFAKGLVVHVVFSLVVWFLACFALLASLATFQVAGDTDPKLASLGGTGVNLVAVAFPFLLVPAFLDDSVPSLNNYVPVIIHRAYYFGLVLLALGIAFPAVRLMVNAAARRWRGLSHLALAMTAGATIYLVALACFAIALVLSWGAEPGRAFHEHLFWGGGHILQFLYALLMLASWFTLMRATLGEESFDPDIFRLAITLLALFALPGIVFYKVFPAFSPLQTEAFRRLQFVVALPSLIVAVGGLTGLLAARRRSPLPWDDPAFVALVLSPIIFGVGGIMGLMVTGSDTRTPAHYHGTIAGVNLALMGLFLVTCMPALGRPVAPSRMLSAQILLFGLGQFLACIGLFLAGGYGAPRKTPSGATHLVDGAVVGMFLHGVGALLAVIGGLLFVVTTARALLRSPEGQKDAA